MKRSLLAALGAVVLCGSTASFALAEEDPDLFSPERTTGGQVGFGVGLAVGTLYGGPQGGAALGVSGALVGHGTDRAIVATQRHTGPAWKAAEKKYGDKLKNVKKWRW